MLWSPRTLSDIIWQRCGYLGHVGRGVDLVYASGRSLQVLGLHCTFMPQGVPAWSHFASASFRSFHASLPVWETISSTEQRSVRGRCACKRALSPIFTMAPKEIARKVVYAWESVADELGGGIRGLGVQEHRVQQTDGSTWRRRLNRLESML